MSLMLTLDTSSMKKVFIILAIAVSAQISHAQYKLNEAALSDAEIYNFRDINTSGLEFSPLPFNVGLLYISPEQKRSKYDRDINEGYFKIRYVSDSESLVLKTLNAQKQHLGPMTYDSDRSILYYTVSQKGKRNRQKARNQIATASYSNNILIPQAATIHDNADYSIQHPAVNNDGSVMIFSANRGDAIGGFDLYQSTLSDTGWTAPVPIIGEINSSSNEAFPVLWRDSILLYASNRPGGHGGLDVYASTWSKGSWSAGTNLGQSVNSSGDDFGLVLTHMRYGYLSSNREGGAGKDDIYEVSFSEDLFLPLMTATVSTESTERNQYTAQIKVSGSDGQIVSDARFTLKPAYSGAGETNDTLTNRSDTSGYASFVLSPDLKYFVEVEHSNYENYNLLIYGSDRIKEMEIELTPKPLPKEVDTSVSLTPPEEPSKSPKAPDSSYVFDPLDYDYNSSSITTESTEQLNSLIQFLKDYPNATVDLLGHTDSRGFTKFNMKLSLERAESVKKIITDSGVSGNRINTIGKGETALRNHCSNGVYCTESEHQFNRRTEIRVNYK